MIPLVENFVGNTVQVQVIGSLYINRRDGQDFILRLQMGGEILRRILLRLISAVGMGMAILVAE